MDPVVGEKHYKLHIQYTTSDVAPFCVSGLAHSLARSVKQMFDLSAVAGVDGASI